MKRKLWQWLLWVKFHLFQRHRFNHLVLEEVAGRPFLVLPHVFNPGLFLTSDFMVQSFDERLIPPGSSVLDLGTGSGIGAVFAARWARRVTAVDINPAAVRCARINVLLNEMEEQVEVCQGDLFAPVHGQRFDVVLFNPPYYRGEPQNMLDHAFHANDVVERFTADLPHYLTPTGHALILLSTTGDAEAFLNLFLRHGFTVAIAARRDIVSEVVTLYQIRSR